MPQVNWVIGPKSCAYLTYPRYGGDPLQSVSDLQSFFATLGVADHVVAHELHADGGHHYHCLLRWDEGFTTRDVRAFDVDGHHPNYSCARGKDSIRRVLGYITKDGDYYGDLSPFEALSADGKQSRHAIWAEIVGAQSVDDFWRLVRELAPEAYVRDYSRLTEYVSAHFSKPDTFVPEFTDFDVPVELAQWFRDNVSTPGLAQPVRRSLILIT